jgi:prepilin signal peptidase PulO-like enzyme (type II secretory pathway)
MALEYRLTGLLVLGVLLGCLANLAAYRLAWNPRAISPWGPAPAGAPPRHPSDRLPIVGWLGLRREAALHGRGFWIRPMVVELLAGLGLTVLYWWEVTQQGLKPQAPVAVPAIWPWDLHVQFVVHAILFWLMLVASLVDFDEQNIPDAITVPGTLLGLLAAAACPLALLRVFWFEPGGVVSIKFLCLTSPHLPPAWLEGFPAGWGLAIGLGCWWLWCVGLLHRTWYSRHGWRRAFALMVARLLQAPSTRPILLMGLAGSAAIALVWFRGGAAWMGLLSALVGMAGGGGLVWLVRIIGRATLGREAMGFGDVTLVAMIGTVIGWQGCLVVFFLGAVFGAIGGLAPLVLRRESVIPFGPALCLAAAVTIVRFPVFWDYLENVLDQLGLLLPLFLAAMFLAMVPLLWIVRSIRVFLFPDTT